MVWGCFRGPGDEDLCVVTDGQAVLAAGCLISLFRSLYAALTSICSSDLMEVGVQVEPPRALQT